MSESIRRVEFMCSFHGCIHNLTLNGAIVSLDGAAVSQPMNSTRLPVALCPADIASLSVPCYSDANHTGNWSVNACFSSPCEANSTCLPTTSGYTCLCRPGSTGNNCDEADICQLTCRDGATCSWTSDGPQCRCPVGRTGARCETGRPMVSSVAVQSVGQVRGVLRLDVRRSAVPLSSR